NERASTRTFLKDALAHYHDDYTLYFANITNSIPALHPFARVMEHDMGLLPGEVSCESFASKRGSGAKPHFDVGFTFNIQVTGRKTWIFAKNDHVLYPDFG